MPFPALPQTHAMQRAGRRKYNPFREAAASYRTEAPCVSRHRGASEGAILLLTLGGAGAMLQVTPPGQLSNLNRAEAVQDGIAPYKRRVSTVREVCQVMLPGHPQSCTKYVLDRK